MEMEIATCNAYLFWGAVLLGAFCGYIVGLLTVGIVGTARDLEND